MDQLSPEAEWITAYHSTAQEADDLRPGPDGFVWLTVSLEHAASFAAKASRKDGSPKLIQAEVNIAGFLVIEGRGRDISRVDQTEFNGISPTLIALNEGLPGIVYREVIDAADRSSFRDPTCGLAVRDLSRIRF